MLTPATVTESLKDIRAINFEGLDEGTTYCSTP